MLQPVVRRTWGPQGDTPLQYRWERHDRVSGISALTVSPQRRHLALYFVLQEDNFRAPDIESFVAEVLRHFPRGIILVLDRWQVHRSVADQLLARFPRRLRLRMVAAVRPGTQSR